MTVGSCGDCWKLRRVAGEAHNMKENALCILIVIFSVHLQQTENSSRKLFIFHHSGDTADMEEYLRVFWQQGCLDYFNLDLDFFVMIYIILNLFFAISRFNSRRKSGNTVWLTLCVTCKVY